MKAHQPPGTARIAQPRLRIHDLHIGRRNPWKDVAHAHHISRFGIRTGRTAAPKDDGVHCRAIVALHPPAGVDVVAGTGGGAAVAGDDEIRHAPNTKAISSGITVAPSISADPRWSSQSDCSRRANMSLPSALTDKVEPRRSSRHRP